jgi:hypothetical protein
MPLRFPGSCKICGSRIAAGDLAYWDAGTKTVTCHAIDCCDADGLTTNKPLTGPWDTRTDIRERTDQRVGSPAPSVIATTFNSGVTVYRNARGRCVDAPCCGCCS